MSTNKDIKIQRSEHQLRSASPETSYEPHYVQKRETNGDKKALGDENKQYVEKVGGDLLKCFFHAPELEEEKQSAFYELLAQQVQTHAKFQDHSTDKLKEVGKLTVAMLKDYELLFEGFQMSSLVIIFKCQSLKSLELLWSDYLSGHLDKMAERYLVTDEVKERLNLETIRVKTTIEEENYWNCRKVLTECSGTCAGQAVAAEDSLKQRPLAIPEAFFQLDPRKVQQQFKEGESTLGNKNPNKLGKRRISEPTADRGLNTNEGITIQRSEQQLPSVSSKPFYEPHYDQKSETNDEKKALAAYKNKQYVKKVGGNLIKCIFNAPQLEEEKHRTFFKLLAQDVQNYADLQDHSTDKLKAVGKLTVAMLTHYELQFEDYEINSLIIIFKCQSLKSLELLWSDYLSGHLDKMAEQYLVTDEVKEKLNLETIRVKTTIEEENYLNCRKVLLEFSGTSASQPIAPEDSMNQGPLAIPQAVSPPDQTTVQQQFKEQTSTSDTKNPKKLGKKGISETTAEHGTSAAQPIVPEDSVCPPDPTTVQQSLKNVQAPQATKVQRSWAKE